MGPVLVGSRDAILLVVPTAVCPLYGRAVAALAAARLCIMYFLLSGQEANCGAWFFFVWGRLVSVACSGTCAPAPMHGCP